MKFEFESFSYIIYLGYIWICCVHNFCDINAEPYNIAFQKPTDQGPATYCTADNKCGTSELAVDGHLGRNPKNGDCSHTKDDGIAQGSWWSVDFQGDYFLASIRILRRSADSHFSKCCKGRMNGTSITGKPGNQAIFNDDYPFSVYRNNDIRVTVPESLSDIKFTGINISIPGPFLTLCEVQVYAACGYTLPTLSNGSWSSGNTSGKCYYYGCVYTATCYQGYKQSTGNPIITSCDANGTWTVPVGYCQAILCTGSVPNVSNSQKRPLNTSSNCDYYGCAYIYNCETGYTESEAVPIISTCNASGEWTILGGTCQVRTCGNVVPSVANSQKRPLNTSSNCDYYGCAYIYNCETGYTESEAVLIISTCSASGEWTILGGTCQVTTCPAPLYTGKNYQIKSETVEFKYEDIVTSQCKEGFELSSGNLTRQCLANGTWSGKEPNCTALTHQDASSSVNTAVIGGSIGGVAAVVVVLFVIVVIVFIRRKRQKSHTDLRYQSPYRPQTEDQMYSNLNVSYQSTVKANTTENNRYSCAVEYIISSPSCAGIGATVKENETNVSNVKTEEYYNVSSFHKKSPTIIMLENLTDFVLAGKTTHDTLESQFQKFSSGMTGSHKIALKPENKKKNRYRQIYAYDDTRVVLMDCKSAGDTDYINASYIQGFDTVRAYIASQGPTKDMINDFWRMVWQQNSSKIVMLTNLKEESKIKCLQYWPDVGSHQYGSVTVRIRDAEVYSDFVIRTLGLKQGLSQEQVVYQFHFTAWPDKGVPKFSSAIVNFRNKVRYTKTRETGPTIVHCSAGIGRTGTYIALDILTEQGKLLGHVDVASCVRDLRRQRVNMVQTLDQYVFLHSALTEALMLSSSATSAAKFPELYRELLHVDPVQRKRYIEATFDMLKNMSPVADENQYSCAREVRNRKRNRYSNILPVSEFMPSLLASSKDGYINAVYLPSYKEKKALILTQMPLKDTKSDFWALVQAQHVRTIVMMNTITEVEREEVYWPDLDETLSFNNTDIETVEVETIGQHKVIAMEMNDKYVESDNTVKLIQCGYWPPSQRLPNSPSDILETLELVQALQQQSGNHPIVVHCMNGVDRSGLFCVMYAVIERLKIEQDVAITQVIEQMRCCRDQIIPSLEQFQFCHEVVLTYIQQFSEYSNFSVQ